MIPFQFASQVFGRLLTHNEVSASAISETLRKIAQLLLSLRILVKRRNYITQSHFDFSFFPLTLFS